MTDIITQLHDVNAAITAIMNGAQEYRIGNRSVKRPDLNSLLDERRRLENSITNNDGIYYTRFDGR